MNLSQQVSLDCVASYSINEVSYSSGVLTVKADYTTDMEGQDCNLTLAFNSSIIVSPSVTLSFPAVSDNIELRVSQNKSQYATIKSIFVYLSYIALALFVLSLSHKLIGAELLVAFELAYLSNALCDK